MDYSRNSGSLQYSSSGTGDDQEQESHVGHSISSNFMNHDYIDPISHSMFDPNLPNYFHSISPPPPPQSQPLVDMDMGWSQSIRSEPNSSQINPMLNSTSVEAVGSTSQDQPAPRQVRHPKKRCRASRKAPTTILTTDTTNFRAMVQEFTGIPSPPFITSNNSPNNFPRTKLLGNIFSTPYNLAMRPSFDTIAPPHNNISPPQYSNSLVDAIASNNSTINFQLSSELSHFKEIMTSQDSQGSKASSTKQSSPKFLLENSEMFGSKDQESLFGIPSSNSQLKMGDLEEFGF